MISLRIRAHHSWPEAVIGFPEAAEDAVRLTALAKLFGARRTCDGWVFTEAKGRKCWKIYNGGFTAESGRIVHPRTARAYAVPQALLVAEVVAP